MDQHDHSETIQLMLPATFKYLNVLSACLGELLLRVEDLPEPEMTIYNIQLAAQEICANIAEHACANDPAQQVVIAITMEVPPRRLVIDFYDTGRSFDPTQVTEPEPGTLHVRGYGLYLVHKLLDEVTYTSQPDKNHWHLVKYFATC